MSKLMHLDDSQSLFFARQLEQIQQGMFSVKYPDLEAEKLLPSRIQLPVEMDQYTFRLMDKRGVAVPFAGHEDGAPLANVDASEETANTMHWASAYGFSIEEIRKAAKLGMDLNGMGAEAARRAIAEKLNYVALMGHSAKSIKGLFNLSSTNTVTPTNSDWAAASSSGDIDAVLQDLFDIVDKSADSTIDLESTKRLLLPKSTIRALSVKRLVSSSSTMSVLEFFKMQRPNVEVMGANYLDTAGSGGVKRAVAYDPSQVQWLVSMPFNQLAPEQKGFRVEINCEGKGGGVICAFPKSVTYADTF